MITKTYSRLLLAFSLVLSIGILASCKKDSSTTANDGKTELLSFGPTGAKPGDTLRFFGRNLTTVTEIQFTGTNAVVKQADFRQQTSDLILLIVPQAAEKGFVTLKTPSGDIVTKTQLNLGIASRVKSMTPQARPGENITLTGDYMNWVKSITFNNNKTVTNFVSKTLNQLVVTIPADAQTGPLVIAYGGTDSTSIQTADTLKVTLPIATSITPNPVKHASNITITGTDLDLVKQVVFQGVSTPVATFVSQSATQLVVKVPGGTQNGKVSLVAASGVSTTFNTDLNVVLPAIATMGPNPIDTGANLTITGTNLDLVNSIAFVGPANSISSFVSQSPTQLVVRVPAGTLKGKVTLNVLNSSLTVQSAADLVINGGLPALPDFPLAIYTDGLQNTFQDWSYTDTHDFNSTANVRQGTKSIKAIYAAGGYQGVTFHAGTAVSTTGYTKLEFSVFGEVGTAGKKINIVINGNYGSPTQVTIVGGEWTTYSINLSTLGSPATISEIVLQSAGWGGTMHIDHVGLR